MTDKAFWSVELGVGMGPLVLGRPKHEVLEILQNHLRGEVDSKELDDTHVHLDDVGFDYVIPRCLGIGALYLVLRLLAALLLYFLAKRKSLLQRTSKEGR